MCSVHPRFDNPYRAGGFLLIKWVQLDKIMKGFLNLILPGNPSDNCSRRGLKEGRRAFGFSFGQPAILADDGTELGLSAPLPGDCQTADTATVSLNKRVNYLTYTTGTVTGNLPPVNGQLRDIYVIKRGTNDVAVTKASADAANIILSAAFAAASSSTVATNTSARFLSNGTNWFRVS